MTTGFGRIRAGAAASSFAVDGHLTGTWKWASPHLAGIHFTGSTEIFQLLWKKVAENLENYRSYPRIVGETGGKDFIVAHHSADVDVVVTGMVRGAFEYQGQKCSAASRAYIPDTMWPEAKEKLGAMMEV